MSLHSPDSADEESPCPGVAERNDDDPDLPPPPGRSAQPCKSTLFCDVSRFRIAAWWLHAPGDEHSNAPEQSRIDHAMRYSWWIPFAIACVLWSPGALVAQHDQPCDTPVRFKEVIFPCIMSPLVINRVRGNAVVLEGNGNEEPIKYRNYVCMSLYTAESGTLVTSTTIDEKGRFDFGAVPPGNYRLLVRYVGFEVGNIPVRIIRSPFHKRRIVVQFMTGGIDVSSCARYDRK
jgi:hypothetical protein